MRRFVYVWLPDWPINRWSIAHARRSGSKGGGEPPLHPPTWNPQAGTGGAPLVLVAEEARGLILTAVSAGARQQGLAPGLSLADARAIVPGLITQPAEPEADARALRRLALWCGRFGPSVAIHGPDGIIIDISGAAHLAGGETTLLSSLGRRLTRFGLPCRIAIADTPGAACALARTGRTRASIAPPGGTAAALAPLPVEGLDLAPDVTRLLRRLGLKRIGQLTEVSRISLERRFPSSRQGGNTRAKQAAAALLDRLDRVLGSKRDPIRPLRPTPLYAVRADFPEPLIAEAGLQQALITLTSALAGQLAAGHGGARRLALTLYRSDGSTAIITVGLGRPQRAAAHMLLLLKEKLSAIDAGFGIDLMVLAARQVEPLAPEQNTLASRAGIGLPATPLSTGASPDEQVAQLLDRLTSRLGARAVFRLQPVESHWPERAQTRSADAVPAREPSREPTGSPGAGPATPWQTPGPKPQRPAFLLDPPEPIAVTAAVPDGPPVKFRWRQCVRMVAAAEGPERLAPEWWRLIGQTRPPGPVPAPAATPRPGAPHPGVLRSLVPKVVLGTPASEPDLLPASRYQRPPGPVPATGNPQHTGSRLAGPARSGRAGPDDTRPDDTRPDDPRPGASRLQDDPGTAVPLTDPLSRTRDYYAVTSADGARFWLFRAGLYAGDSEDNEADADPASAAPPAWYLHGVFA